jgi:transcription elongation factor Elf1
MGVALSEPVDVYSLWIDACEDAQNGVQEEREEEPVRRGRLEKRRHVEDDDDLFGDAVVEQTKMPRTYDSESELEELAL